MTNKKDEWGNIELPGLSDEELFGKNWTRIALRQQQANDPVFQKQHLAGIAKRNSSEDFAQSILQRNLDPTYKQKLNKGIAKRSTDYSFMQTEEYRQAHMAGMQQLKNDPNYKHVRKNVGKQNSKKIQTPDGVFDSRKLAAEHYKVDPAMISYRIKRYPDQYYYITDD